MSVTLVNPYCTVAEVRSDLRNSKPSIEDDIRTAINAASRVVETRTGRTFYHVQEARIITPSDKLAFDETLFLPRPIIKLNSIKVAGVTLVSGVDYYANMKTGELTHLKEHWEPAIPDRLIEVDFEYGYSQLNNDAVDRTKVPTGLPDNVNMATRLIADALSGHLVREVTGVDGTKVDINDRKIPDLAWKLLGPQMPACL